jgi:hypothetical protein
MAEVGIVAEAVEGLPPWKRAILLRDLEVTPAVVDGLRERGFLCVGDLADVPDRELLAIPSVGRGRLSRLREVLVALRHAAGPAEAPGEGSLLRSLVGALPPGGSGIPLAEVEGLSGRTRRCLMLARIECIGDLIRRPEALRETKGFGETSRKNLCDALRALAAAIDEIDGVPSQPERILDALLTRRRFVVEVRARIDSIPPGHGRRILERRWLGGTRRTLAEIAADLGITRDRVRQIEARALEVLRGTGRLARLVDRRIGTLRKARGRLDLTELEALDPWFSGVGDLATWTQGVLAAIGSSYRGLEHGTEGELLVVPAEAASLEDLGRELVAGLDRDLEPAARARSARAFLEERGVPELLPLLLDHLARTRPPTGKSVVLGVLQRASRPMHVREIAREVERGGSPLGARAVHNLLISHRIPRVAPSTYVHPDRLPVGEELSRLLRRRVVALLEEKPDRQWTTGHLLAELRRRADRPEGLGDVSLLEHALRTVPELVDLGRGVWALAGRHERRIPVVDALRRAAVDAGGPVSWKELLARAQRIRTFATAGLRVSWPLVRLQNGLVGLGERELGVPDAAFRRIAAAVRNELVREPGRVSLRRLEALVAACGPGLVPSSSRLLALALAAEDTHLRFDASRGLVLREPGRPASSRRDFGALDRLTVASFFVLLAGLDPEAGVREVRRALLDELGVRLSDADVAALLGAARGTPARATEAG